MWIIKCKCLENSPGAQARLNAVYNVEKSYTGSLHSGFSPKDLYTSSEVDFPVETGVCNVITPILYAYTLFPHGRNLRNHFMMVSQFRGLLWGGPISHIWWDIGKGLGASWWLLGGVNLEMSVFAPVIVAETKQVGIFYKLRAIPLGPGQKPLKISEFRISGWIQIFVTPQLQKYGFCFFSQRKDGLLGSNWMEF